MITKVLEQIIAMAKNFRNLIKMPPVSGQAIPTLIIAIKSEAC
jgi:hypothetical protein